MTTGQFADAVVVMIDDDSACARASNRDLLVMEGVLGFVADKVHAELVSRKLINE